MIYKSRYSLTDKISIKNMKNSCSTHKKELHSMPKFIKGLGIMMVLMLAIPFQGQSQHVQVADSLNETEISNFGDYTVQEALIRIPGVQVNRDGQLNLRGVGYNNYYVLVNGQRLSATADNTRGVDLSAFPVGLIQSISWQKVLTPDMDADGLAGAIRLNTFKPNVDRGIISGSIGGGLNPEYLKATGANGRAWLRYAGPVTDDLGMTIDMNYQRDQQARETLGMNYGTADFGSGTVDVVENFSPGFQHQDANRFSANLRFDYDPTEDASYYAHGMINLNESGSAFHQNTWNADGGWVDANTVEGGSFRYGMNFTQRDVSQYTFHAGGENEFDNFVLDYKAGWSQSDVSNTENLFPFEDTNIDYTINTENSERPVVNPAEGKPMPADMRLEEMNYIIDDYRDQEITARINAEIPMSFGSLKFGANTIMKEQDANNRGAYSKYRYSFLGALNLEGFETGNLVNRSVFDDYQLDRLISTDEALSFFQSSIQNMRLDQASYYKESEIYNYYADQQVYGGYGMATLDLDPIHVLIGARVEHTNSEYEGRVVTYNRFNQYQETVDTAGTSSETEFFPNVQLTYQLTPQASVKAAYSKTISRPTFSYLAPFELQIPQDTSFFAGNPNLSPVSSNNIDLDIDYNLETGGSISVSGFYKSISNLIERTQTTRLVQSGEYEYYEDLIPDGEQELTANLETYQNSDRTGTVYGVEVALQKQLNFLPGVFEHFGTYVNYTWSESNYENQRGGETSIPGQSPHVVNAALNYSEAKFFAQLSYHWTAELLYELGQTPQQAPALGNNPVFLDSYQDGYEELSATLRYDVNPKLQLWANFYNILGRENTTYTQEQDLYPTNIYQRNGTEFNVGVRLTF